MAKAGRKKRAVRPIKFGLTAYLVPGKDDRVIGWLEGIPSDQRWRMIKEMLDYALSIEESGELPTAQTGGIESGLPADLVADIRSLVDFVLQMRESGFSPGPAAAATNESEPAVSDAVKDATSRLLANTKE